MFGECGRGDGSFIGTLKREKVCRRGSESGGSLFNLKLAHLDLSRQALLLTYVCVLSPGKTIAIGKVLKLVAERD